MSPSPRRTPFEVSVLDETQSGALDAEKATRLCALTFSERGYPPEGLGEVSVALVGPEEIRDLNRRFRGRDYPTDVLSFEIDGPEGEMVGEIVICPEAAEMSLEELVVHGALHLSGMDHPEDAFEESEMARAQKSILRRANAEA